ncbi:MAG: hypothetical protein JSS10_06165 [Verrucomicrobia bacterium]|nr:hypothetical protein [Verrucomicrobiota bacterium]
MAIIPQNRQVSLSADIEFLIDPVTNERTLAQAQLKQRFWSIYAPDLEKLCHQHFKKGSSYSFHVCFVMTKDIDSPEHREKIKRAFVKIVKNHISNTVFCPDAFRAYVLQDKEGKFLQGRSPNNSPVVLVPKNPDDFKRINQALAEKLKELNTLWNKKYELADDLLPEHYTPHITIINRPILFDLEKKVNKTKKDLLEQLNAKVPVEAFTLKDHKYQI